MGPKCTVPSLLCARANIQRETSAPAVTAAQTRLFILLNDLQACLRVTSALKTDKVRKKKNGWEKEGLIDTERACVLTSYGKVTKATSRSPERREDSGKDVTGLLALSDLIKGPNQNSPCPLFQNLTGWTQMEISLSHSVLHKRGRSGWV